MARSTYTTSGIKAETYRPRNTKTISVNISQKRKKSIQLPPVLTLALGFIFIILIGTGLLCMPFSTADHTPAPFLTALFTATSSVCVTGLALVETGTYWSFAGQAIIMVLIEIGGFGFMCSSSLMLLLLGQRIGIRERTLTRQSLDWADADNLKDIIKNVVNFTLFIEAAGALLLFVNFLQYYDIKTSIWYALFHAISGFNNAGMDILGYGDSLAHFINNPFLLLSITFLVFMGSIGFAIVADIIKRKKYRHTRLDTKIVLSMTAMLIIIPTIYFCFDEWNNPETIGNLSSMNKIIVSFFSATVLRTAGFSVFNISSLDLSSIIMLIFLMSCGAASGSTGGGIKINNIGLLFYATISTLKGDEHPNAFGKELSQNQINKAIALIISYFAAGVIFTLLLSVTEHADLMLIIFETFSAMGTVGSSMGLTSALSIPGQNLIIIIMFLGRLGPMTLVSVMLSRSKHRNYRNPVEYIRMG